MKAHFLWLTVALGVAVLAMQPVPGEKPIESGLEKDLAHLQDAHVPVVYAALYALPETQAAFINAAGDRGWSSYHPSDIASQLSLEQKRMVVAASVKTLNGMSEKDRAKYFRRLRSWLIAYDQLDVCMRLTSLEQALAAVYAVPLTRPLFDPIIKNRGFTPETVSAKMVGETLASGEAAGITYALLNKLSALSSREQVKYFRDLYDRLLAVLGDWQ
jgi:hypothetical protein